MCTSREHYFGRTHLPQHRPVFSACSKILNMFEKSAINWGTIAIRAGMFVDMHY